MIVGTNVLPETGEQSLALYDVFCGLPAKSWAERKIVTSSDIDPLLTCLRQRNNLPTDQVLISACHGGE
jgi:hypothetical protein